jgi:nucleotide-binding universal stress UspA family protein
MSVIVSVDGSASSAAAVRVAAQEARYRDSQLVAIAAYSGEILPSAPAGRPVGTLRTPQDERDSVELMLRGTVGAALGEDAGQVDHQIVSGQAGRRFLAAAKQANAELIVLGLRSGLSTLPGSVSQYVLRHAPCPVMVVPEDSAGR